MAKVFLAGALAALLAIATARAAPEVLLLTPGNMLAQSRTSTLLLTVTGTYRRLSGTLRFDPETRACAVDVTFRTRSLALPNALVRRQVMSKSFLDPAKYPTSRFAGTCADHGTQLSGTLTTHGETHPFAMKLRYVVRDGRLVGLDATGAFDRYEWGLKGLGMVGRTVRVTDKISLDGKLPY